MELPAHPEPNDDDPDQAPARRPTLGTRIAIAILVALVAVVILLHLTGVMGPS